MYLTFRVFIGEHIHLIPGHPSINDGAIPFFESYQKQASQTMIQFHCWPLRNVSLSIIPIIRCQCSLVYICLVLVLLLQKAQNVGV
jgi:hypothetical protein